MLLSINYFYIGNDFIGDERRIIMDEKSNVIDFGSQYLNKELNQIIQDQHGNGWHRVIALVSALKDEGLTDIEIANAVKGIPRIY